MPSPKEPIRKPGQDPDETPEEFAKHRHLQLFDKGYRRGMDDWEAGIHTDPYVPEIGWMTTDTTSLSLGWEAGQDRMFRWAAGQFDEIAQRDMK